MRVSKVDPFLSEHPWISAFQYYDLNAKVFSNISFVMLTSLHLDTQPLCWWAIDWRSITFNSLTFRSSYKMLAAALATDPLHSNIWEISKCYTVLISLSLVLLVWNFVSWLGLMPTSNYCLIFITQRCIFCHWSSTKDKKCIFLQFK